jgi:ribosomal protein S3AE
VRSEFSPLTIDHILATNQHLLILSHDTTENSNQAQLTLYNLAENTGKQIEIPMASMARVYEGGGEKVVRESSIQEEDFVILSEEQNSISTFRILFKMKMILYKLSGRQIYPECTDLNWQAFWDTPECDESYVTEWELMNNLTVGTIYDDANYCQKDGDNRVVGITIPSSGPEIHNLFAINQNITIFRLRRLEHFEIYADSIPAAQNQNLEDAIPDIEWDQVAGSPGANDGNPLPGNLHTLIIQESESNSDDYGLENYSDDNNIPDEYAIVDSILNLKNNNKLYGEIPSTITATSCTLTGTGLSLPGDYTGDCVCDVQNQPPIAINDTTQTPEDTAIDIDVLSNDSDPEEDPITITSITQPNHGAAVNNTTDITYTPDDNFSGKDSLQYHITDGNSHTDSATVYITVTPENDAPSFTSEPDTTATEDSLYTYDIIAGDIDDGDSLVIEAVEMPAWLGLQASGARPVEVKKKTSQVESRRDLNRFSFRPVRSGTTATATLTGTPQNADVGTHEVILKVTDAAGDSALQEFTITVENTNDAPYFTSTPDTTATEDSLYTYDITAGDIDDGDSLTIEAVEMPAWLGLQASGARPVEVKKKTSQVESRRDLNRFSFRPVRSGTTVTATLTGTPQNADVGTHEVILKVTDAAGDSALQEFTITVENTNDAPYFTSTPDTTATEDSLYIYGIIAEDVDDGDSLVIEAVEMPAWLGLHGASRARPVEVEKKTSQVASRRDLNRSSFRPVRSGTTATATLTGTPENPDVGTYEVILKVTDAAGDSALQIFTITVENTNDPPSFTSTPDTTATEDSLYTYAIIAEDIDDADSLFIEAVEMPVWLGLQGVSRARPVEVEKKTSQVSSRRDLNRSSFRPVRSIDGSAAPRPQRFSKPLRSQTTATLTGTSENADVGTHNVILKVTDAAGDSALQEFTITVENTNDAPDPFSRISPQDSSTVEHPSVTFIWEPSHDVDGDAINYQLDIRSTGIDTTVLSISDTTFTLDFSQFDILEDQISWLVTAFDGQDSTLTDMGGFTLILFELIGDQNKDGKVDIMDAQFYIEENPVFDIEDLRQIIEYWGDKYE